MNNFIEGFSNWKTTIVAVIVFLLGLLPAVGVVLSDFTAFLQQLLSVVQEGNIWGLLALKPLVLNLIASVTLLIARDWRGGGS
ncbi:MAG TPA: hypothetical protein PLX39_15485 [Pyrinomonadaceae bacterium]|nr:hypothetical protein [Pyrinomonadaceae bacterium]